LPGRAEDRVRALLEPFADILLPGAIEGYSLPEGDGTARNRGNIRRAAALLEEAGWQVVNGVLQNEAGTPLTLSALLRNDGLLQQAATYMNLYAQALERLGIALSIENVDSAQYSERTAAFDFDLTFFRRALSLSPGNEQRLYWGSETADAAGSRNLMGMASPAADAMIDAMLAARSREDFVAAVRALDRVLISGRYVIPIHKFAVGRIAHLAEFTYPADRVPIYGDGIWFLPKVWWMKSAE
ncbi:MAG: ABC transporter substrate-binding protein, partial [Pseudomonadota bacterium]